MASVTSVARLMPDQDVGAVLVTEEGHLRCLVSDRDLVLWACAEGADPERATVMQAASDDLVTITPDDSLDRAVPLSASTPYGSSRSSRATVRWAWASSPWVTLQWNATRNPPSATSARPGPTHEDRAPAGASRSAADVDIGAVGARLEQHGVALGSVSSAAGLPL